MKTSILSH